MPTRFVTNPGRPGRKPLRRPARSRKNPMYPSYSGESFDVAQSVGAMLTQDDRDAGLPAPKYGYSSENFDLAESVIREGSGALSGQKVYEIAKSKKASRSRKNPAHLAHPGKFRQGQVVRLRGSRKRYVIATDVDPDVFGYHLVALSGGEVGSAPSGVRANDLELDADQTVSFSGAQAHKLARKYENTARVHQEHQRWLASEYPVSRRKNPLVRASKPKRPFSREQKAVKLVEDALKANIVIHWTGPKNEGTAGRYLMALGPSKFAVIAYGRSPWDFYGTANEVAWSLVENLGVGNVIDALKATARMHDTAYKNLDTPISWATPRRR